MCHSIQKNYKVVYDFIYYLSYLILCVLSIFSNRADKENIDLK